MTLLSGLSYVLARHREASPISEVAKHVAVALVIVLVGEGIGHWITVHVT